MQLFEDLIKCKDCMNNMNNKCFLFPRKDVNEEDTGCYVGIDRNNKQKLVESVLSERKTADELEEVINTYKTINYTREWFDTHKYRYRLGQDFNPYIGEYF